MGQRLSELHDRVATVRQLGGVVSALRGIAASRAQQSRGLLEGVRAYADIVAQAIAQALTLLPVGAGDGPPAPGRRPALLLFCAEQGFAGPFSDAVFDAAGGPPAEAELMVVGSRGVRLAQARGLRVAWQAPMVSQAASAGALANRIAAMLEDRMREGDIARVDMVFARPAAGGEIAVERRSLLPLDLRHIAPARMRQPPLVNLPPPLLLERLAAEYLFAALNEAVLYGFAAENTARMTAMAAARAHIDRRLEELAREERLARQDEITEEVVELASGTEAQRTIGGRRPPAMARHEGAGP
ncbi:FoF1 ATP synthase subunit gamma [Pigmentiphaga soli]|uniref:FoF1 ATP synthase subunit gamma n=1 Tax=Pigmentiphaga soli TaxID=1007095 RepID=A0ABP8HCD8_9BURK